LAQNVGGGALEDGIVLVDGQPEELALLVVPRHVHVPVEIFVLLGEKLHLLQ